jgi:hypothetical protein
MDVGRDVRNNFLELRFVSDLKYIHEWSKDIGGGANIVVYVALYDITFTLDDHYHCEDVYSVRLSSKAKGWEA